MRRDDAQPEVKPRRQPSWLGIRCILQITDIVRRKRGLPFKISIYRHDNAERRAHSRCRDY